MFSISKAIILRGWVDGGVVFSIFGVLEDREDEHRVSRHRQTTENGVPHIDAIVRPHQYPPYFGI